MLGGLGCLRVFRVESSSTQQPLDSLRNFGVAQLVVGSNLTVLERAQSGFFVKHSFLILFVCGLGVQGVHIHTQVGIGVRAALLVGQLAADVTILERARCGSFAEHAAKSCGIPSRLVDGASGALAARYAACCCSVPYSFVLFCVPYFDELLPFLLNYGCI